MVETALRDKAEVFLAGDARIDGFTLTDDDNCLHIMARGAPAWFCGQRAAAHAAIRTRILRQWQMVYDRSYRWDGEIRAPNFDAWVSGFTGARIPPATMEVWLDDVLAQLRAVPHARVLDIGCGVGLVLAALAQGGVTYDGVDFSEEAIGSLAAWVATQNDLRHVRLVQRAAHELDDLALDPPELAIMNSVVQYFPDADYLGRVLAAAMARLASGGRIFLGDLRAAALLPMRAVCVAAARAPEGACVGQVRTDARAVLGLAREFAIDPGFFAGLAAALPRLGRVRFSLKPAAADRELAAYRYDAMLEFDQPAGEPAPLAADGSLDALVETLGCDRPAAVAVCGLANARLTTDVALARDLAAASADRPLAEVMATAAGADPVGIEPESLAAAAAAHGYIAEMRFTPGAGDGRFDALLRRAGVAADWPARETNGPLTNDPLGADLAVKLRRDLQTALDAALGGPNLARLDLSAPP